MRYVDRSKVVEPKSLSGPSIDVKAEKAAAAHYYSTYDPTAKGAKAYAFKEYNGDDVIQKLRELFSGKCAYCEMELTGDLEVEHFRPKGKVSALPSHPGYWWLAHSWTNLFAACAHCNKRRRQYVVTASTTLAEFQKMLIEKSTASVGKGNQFPVFGTRAKTGACLLGDEFPKLIDPTADNPAQYFKWVSGGDYSLVVPLPGDTKQMERALCSITVFALNRALLVKNRSRILNELKIQAVQIEKDLEADLMHGGARDDIDKALARVDALHRFAQFDSPYSEMAKSFIVDFEARLQARMA